MLCLLAKREERRDLDGIEFVLSGAVLRFNRIISSVVEREIERRKKERKKKYSRGRNIYVP